MAQIQFSTFRLGDGLYGINVLLVREINRNLDLTPVDRAPEYVTGLLNLRGQIVTVLDAGARLELERRQVAAGARCIVLKTNKEIEKLITEGFELEETSDDIVGLLVDGIGDIVTIDDNDIEPAPANVGGVEEKFIRGVVKLKGELLTILKADLIVGAQVNS